MSAYYSFIITPPEVVDMPEKPSSSAHPFLPAHVTAGQLAELVGASERMIRGRIADGRLPREDGGRIILRTVVQAGIEQLAERQRERGRGGVDMAPTEASDVLQRLAIWLQCQRTPGMVAEAAAESGIPLDQVQRLYETLLQRAPALANATRKDMHLSAGDLGPFERLKHLPPPDWSALAAAARGA